MNRYSSVLGRFSCLCSEISRLEDEGVRQVTRGQGPGQGRVTKSQGEAGHATDRRRRKQAEKGPVARSQVTKVRSSRAVTRAEIKMRKVPRKKDGEWRWWLCWSSMLLGLHSIIL